MKTLLFPLLSMLLFSCYFGTNENSSFDHDDTNYDITVLNESGQKVILEYTHCLESGGGSPQMLVLPPAERASVHVCGSFPSEASVEAICGGKIRTYDVDPGIWGTEKITIRAEDFED